ncbi:alpha-L-fucosidase [Psychromicrobium xiongbiense]|uniref:alpha-L-fucosidase n=1 Tax=Psychromicrobium xiongbiense TaxID=3051184 RepID=UPI00255658CA|nr:alpha-L-fucosidase [Psychromicrobium sp. YIM S02556]
MIELQYGAQSAKPRQDEAMRRFRSHRLGQFIHWGLYALPGGLWEGRSYPFAAEFLSQTATVPEAEWAQLAGQFLAENFDAAQWAGQARTMGMRYATFTTKHHEGFCLWPSELTDFHVGNTPFGRDALGELVAAYQAEGIDVYLYYSVLDWHHPDWRYRLDTDDDAAAFDRYLAFALGQLEELATRYPGVKGFWFDGTWDESVKANGAWTLHVEQRLKELLPGAIVSSRLRADDLGARHRDSNGVLMGDYESGYERRLPDPWDRRVTATDWEACMTIPQATWGFHRGAWAAETVKHPWDLVDMLAHCTSLGGNLLINFGPRGDGTLAANELRVGQAIGRWLTENGEAIYGCGVAEAWSYPGWGYYTSPLDVGSPGGGDSDQSRVYALVTKIPASGRIRLMLPAGTVLEECWPLAEAGTGFRRKEVEPGIAELDLGSCLGSAYRDGPLVFALTTLRLEAAGSRHHSHPPSDRAGSGPDKSPHVTAGGSPDEGDWKEPNPDMVN